MNKYDKFKEKSYLYELIILYFFHLDFIHQRFVVVNYFRTIRTRLFLSFGIMHVDFSHFFEQIFFLIVLFIWFLFNCIRMKFFILSSKNLMAHGESICFPPFSDCCFYSLGITEVLLFFLLSIRSTAIRTFINHYRIFKLDFSLFLSLLLRFLPF